MKFFRWRQRKDDDLNEEIQSYLELSADERIERGETEEEARLNAQRAFGSVSLVKEDTREVWGWAWLERLWQDLRFGVRMLLKQPGFTLIAVCTLALGIGANMVVFTWLKAVYLQPLHGVTNSERLVMLHSVLTQSEQLAVSVSYPDYQDYRDRNEVFSGLAVFSLETFNLSNGTGHPERVWGSLVSGNYFDVLSARTVLGRTFTTAEDSAASVQPVAVISHQLWQQRFASDPALIGKTIRINNREFTVIGVTAAGFGGSYVGLKLDVWLPVRLTPQLAQLRDKLDSRGAQWLQAVARLKDGVTFAQAQTNVQGIAARLAQEYPKTNEGIGATLLTLADSPNGAGQMTPALALLLAVAGLVLLLACTNVANMLLARALNRRRELGIRRALGASSARLLAQMLSESLLLAALGGLAGLVLATWLSEAMSWLLPPMGLPLALNLTWDARVLGFALALTLLTVAAIGLLPAWRATRVDPLTALKDDGGGFAFGVQRARLRSALVVMQVAVSLVLLVGAGLFLRSLAVQRQINLGFAPEHALLVSLDVFPSGYDQKRGAEFYRQLTERVSVLPGVESVSLSSRVPPQLFQSNSMDFDIEGYAPRDDERLNLQYETVAPRYFQTMQIPLIAGREFSASDEAKAASVAIVNETLARRYWGGQSAVGRRLRDSGGKWYTVVGVARDVKYMGVTAEAQPWIYFANAQAQYVSMMTLIVRTAGEPLALRASVRAAVRALDGTLAVFDEKTLAAHSNGALFMDRLMVIFLSVFGALALLLAALGLYGVLAYTVAQRTRELGIRMALGAQASAVLRLVLKQGMWLALLGVVIGLAAALVLTRGLTSLLFGVSVSDPLTFVLVAALLLAVALLACWIPAWRATKVDPLIALRSE